MDSKRVFSRLRDFDRTSCAVTKFEPKAYYGVREGATQPEVLFVQGRLFYHLFTSQHTFRIFRFSLFNNPAALLRRFPFFKSYYLDTHLILSLYVFYTFGRGRGGANCIFFLLFFYFFFTFGPPQIFPACTFFVSFLYSFFTTTSGKHTTIKKMFRLSAFVFLHIFRCVISLRMSLCPPGFRVFVVAA